MHILITKSVKFVKRNIMLVFILLFISILSADIFLYKKLSKHSAPNIILIVVDALRPDHLGCYGYERNTSPNIDRLSKESTRFTSAISAAGWTFEAVPSILTGVYSPVHQILGPDNLLNPKLKTIAQRLNITNYQCIFWSNHISLKQLDIKNGFQKTYIASIYKNCKPVLNDYAFTTKIIHWLKLRHKKSPFFFYIHYVGCHVPYESPTPYKYMYMYDKFRGKPEFIPISNFKDGSRQYEGIGNIPYAAVENNITDLNYYISKYDGVISYMDVQIGRLLYVLKELNFEDNTMIILTADHGEMLGEHKIYFNHCKGYENNIRVPLIIRLPGLFPKGKVISRQVSLIDIVPTILEVAGLDDYSNIQGESLLSFIKPFRIYSKKYSFSFDHLWRTLRTDNWKLIYNGDSHTWELYNLRNDPKEKHNLIRKNIVKFEKLKKLFEDFSYKYSSHDAVIKNNFIISNDDKETLKSLGYIQ